MPKMVSEMSPIEVRRLRHPGSGRNVTFAAGGVSGLLLQITPSGARSWILRTLIRGKRRSIGLGGYPDVTLAQARERAREVKDKVWRNIDPVAEKMAARAALLTARRKTMTFADAFDRYCEAKLSELGSDADRVRWRSSIQRYALPQIGDMPVGDLAVQDILKVLEPVWIEKTETASRVRARIEAILSWATVAGHRAGDNPARWAGNLKELLPAPSKVATSGNQPAVALSDAPAWFEALRQRQGTGARALEFAVMCASRSGEVRGALWDEVDLNKALWTISAARMKMDREHRVPLSGDAVALLQALPRLQDNPLVFPAARGGQLSDMTLSATMKRMHEADIAAGGAGWLDPQNKRPSVPHGVRSTFRDWAAEQTDYPGELAEIALAHKIGSAVEAAYRRGDMLEKRRKMMTDWAAFLGGNVNGR